MKNFVKNVFVGPEHPEFFGVRVKVQKVHKDSKIPTYAHTDDACCDLYSIEDITVPVDGFRLVPTGIAIEIPTGWEVQVRPRSGLALKHGISVNNSPGTVDAQYRNEIKVLLINHGDKPFNVKKGDRIAQMCIKPVYKMDFVEVNKLSDSERGLGGWGSTGK